MGAEEIVRHRTMWTAFAQQGEIEDKFLGCFGYPYRVAYNTQPDRYGQSSSLRPSGIQAKEASHENQDGSIQARWWRRY